MLEWWRKGLIGPYREAKLTYYVMRSFTDPGEFAKVFPDEHEMANGGRVKLTLHEALGMLRR